jgi:hypothetical protein
MHERRIWIAVGALIAASGIAAPASPALAGSNVAPSSGQLVIHHQVRGCHAWAYDNGPFQATQSIRLARAGTLTITDTDVMSHTLVETSGPAARMSGGAKGHMGMMGLKGPIMKVSFPKAGTYHFRTHAGEDYMSGVKTTGPDNILRLTVVVR